MKAQHTAGPWKIIQDPIKQTSFINIPAHNNMVAVSGVNREANALLIAAAPELLMALEMAEATLQRIAPDGSRATQGTRDVIAAAIKKAGGARL